jgi:hypothetical protein
MERRPPSDQAQSRSEKIGTSSRPDRSKPYQCDLEFGDIRRDPRFLNGRWLGIAMLIAVALCTVYIGFISVWAALALAVAW